MIAKKDPYINEAYDQLEIISQDKEKQAAYTSRMKSIMDYNTIMAERYETGRAEGIAIGENRGRAEGRAEGRQELLNQLLKSGVKIPDELLKNISAENK